MKKILITLLVIGFIFAELGPAFYLRAEEKNETTETWEGIAKCKFMGVSYDITLVLKKKENEYESGTATILKIITRELKNIKFENNTLEFELIYQESNTDYVFKAILKVTNKQMKGTWEIKNQDISGTIELKKEEK